MAKTLLIGDIHSGVSKNSPIFHNTLVEYGKWVKTIMIKHDLTHITQMGDIFDHRFNISAESIHSVCDFFEILKEYKFDIICGNHDSYYNYDASKNSLQILKNNNNIRIHDSITIDNDIVYAGWGVKLENIPCCRLFFGHIDVVGYELTKGKISQHGFRGADLMQKISGAVFTGHYHKSQIRYYDKKPLCYTGSAYPLSWNDVDDPKYVYILDMDTLEYTKIENTISPRFIKINNRNDLSIAKNNFISIESSDKDELDFINETVKLYNPLDIKVNFFKKDIKELSETESLVSTLNNFRIINLEDVLNDFVDRMLNLNDDEKIQVKHETIKLYKEFAI